MSVGKTHPIPQGQGACPRICVLHDTFVVTLLCAPFLSFFDKPLFSIYFRKFLVNSRSSEMTKEYTDRLLSFEIFLVSRAKFSYSVVFSASILGRLRVKVTAVVSTTSDVLLSLSMSTASGLLQCTVSSVMMELSPYKFMLSDSITGSG